MLIVGKSELDRRLLIESSQSTGLETALDFAGLGQFDPSHPLAVNEALQRLMTEGGAIARLDAVMKGALNPFTSQIISACLTGDHRVLTRRGWRSITAIQVGEEVLTFNKDSEELDSEGKGRKTYHQEWKPVTGVTSHAVDRREAADTLYRMQGSGMDVIATRDHRMLIARLSPHTANALQVRKKAVDYETVGELLPGLHRQFGSKWGESFVHSATRAVVSAGANCQPGVKVVIPGLQRICDWWWEKDEQVGFLQFLGFWLGDGWLHTEAGDVCISLEEEESKQWLETLLKALLPRWWRRSPKPTQPGHVVYTIRCPPLFEFCRLMAVGPLGYNPRDPVQLRGYPHFSEDVGLVVKEGESAYYHANNSGSVTTWTEEEMLAVMRGADGGSTSRSPADPITPQSTTRSLRSSSESRRSSFSDSFASTFPPCERSTSALSTESVADAIAATATMEHEEDEDKREELLEKAVMEEDVKEVSEGAPGVEVAVDEEGVAVQIPHGEAIIGEGAAEAARVAGTIGWWNQGQWNLISAHWFHLKRWLGSQQQIADVYSRLSRKQAIHLLDGFCRTSQWETVQYDEQSGEPTRTWQCSHSSFPLIDHLQLIGQLAGARVTLRLHSEAGMTTAIEGQPASLTVPHWLLSFVFTESRRGLSFQTAPLAQPVDVSADIAGRGYYGGYKDDGRVYCLSVEGNSNFLTQRLSNQRLENGQIGVRAHSVYLGNCLPSGQLKPFPFNGMSLMTLSGAKGSAVNFSQISCLLGQQELEGKRVPYMATGKTLPSFRRFDPTPRAGGYITDRFLTGIRPQEYFFHHMAGREGLIDTAVKTSRSGYLQRCLIKHLESLTVNYDYTVRDSDASIVQFHYGEDSVDIARTAYLTRFDFLTNNWRALLHKLNPPAAIEALDTKAVEAFTQQHRRRAEERRRGAGEEEVNAFDPVLSKFSPGAHLGSVSDSFTAAMADFIEGDSERLFSSPQSTSGPSSSLSRVTPSKFTALMQLNYLYSLVQPGESVGILAAQSVGEPSTQMTLNTFHLAGHGGANVTLGIPRLRELIMTASARIKTPIMEVPTEGPQGVEGPGGGGGGLVESTESPPLPHCRRCQGGSGRDAPSDRLSPLLRSAELPLDGLLLSAVEPSDLLRLRKRLRLSVLRSPARGGKEGSEEPPPSPRGHSRHRQREEGN